MLYRARMDVRTRCSACGIEIRFDDPHVELVARGDRFWHPSCVETHTEPYTPPTPAYHLPRSW